MAMNDILFGVLSFPLLLCFLHIFSFLTASHDADCAFSMRNKVKRKVYTEFAFNTSDFNAWTVSRIKKEVGDYIPPWWYNKHLGSLISFGKSPNLKFERETFTLVDGSVFGVDWYPRKPSGTETERLCLHLPGLGLSSDANMSQIFAKTFAEAGFIVGILIPRGLSGIRLETAKLWNAGRTEDCKYIVENIHEKFTMGGGNAKVFLSGFSASSSIITKTLTELSKKKPHLFENSPVQVIGAMCCCVNYDYEETRTKLEKTIVGKFYSFLLAAVNKKTLNANAHIHDQMDPTTLQKMKKAYQLSQFDAAAHVVNGFPSEKDMYAQISTFPEIQQMPVPFLALLASDDPLYTAGMDKTKYTANSNVLLMETSHGNHLGFYEGDIFQAFTNTVSYTYPAKLALLFSNSILHFDQEKKTNMKTII